MQAGGSIQTNLAREAPPHLPKRNQVVGVAIRGRVLVITNRIVEEWRVLDGGGERYKPDAY